MTWSVPYWTSVYHKVKRRSTKSRTAGINTPFYNMRGARVQISKYALTALEISYQTRKILKGIKSASQHIKIKTTLKNVYYKGMCFLSADL